MVDFIVWIFSSFQELLTELVGETINFINTIFKEYTTQAVYGNIDEIEINLVLFSETPIVSINLYDLLLIVFSILYTVIFIVIVYKIIKKVFVKITGWRKW